MKLKKIDCFTLKCDFARKQSK